MQGSLNAGEYAKRYGRTVVREIRRELSQRGITGISVAMAMAHGHLVYLPTWRMPWQGDPRVNIQGDHGKAKPYQVRQVLAAIEKLEGEQS